MTPIKEILSLLLQATMMSQIGSISIVVYYEPRLTHYSVFGKFQTTPVHTLAAGMDSLQGVIMEIVLTFSLIFTVYATLVDPKKGFLEGLGPLLTGLVVGANIMAGGPFSGASMNPARSFGPALVAGVWTDHWVYWVGPLIGGGLAGLIYENFFIVKSHVPLARDEEAY